MSIKISTKSTTISTKYKYKKKDSLTFFFSFISGTSFNKIDDDDMSIMAPHQSYFDEYPSGAGTIDFLEEIISI
jgi:hypothetical protein